MDESNLRLKPLSHLYYQQLRGTTHWEKLGEEQVKLALDNDLFSICVVDGEKPVGMGRVVGDGAIYFYIQDVVVHPKYQGKGVGRMIMVEIEKYLDKFTSHYAFVGLMAAEGVTSFYYQFGYQERPGTGPGMFKIIRR